MHSAKRRSVWPSGRNKDFVWSKTHFWKATPKTWLERSVFLLGLLQWSFVFLIPLVLCDLRSDDVFKCFPCGPQRLPLITREVFATASSTSDQWKGMWQHQKEPPLARSNTPMPVLGCLADAPSGRNTQAQACLSPKQTANCTGVLNLRRGRTVANGSARWNSFTTRTIASTVRSWRGRWAIYTRGTCGGTRDRKRNARRKRSFSQGTRKREWVHWESTDKME